MTIKDLIIQLQSLPEQDKDEPLFKSDGRLISRVLTVRLRRLRMSHEEEDGSGNKVRPERLVITID